MIWEERNRFQIRNACTGKECDCRRACLALWLMRLGTLGRLYADFVQSDEVRNSMKATADKAIECMDNIKELNELEEQLKAEEQESEGED